MKHSLVFVAFLFLVVTWLVGCAGESPSSTTPTLVTLEDEKATGYNLANLIDDLRAAGATVEPTEELVDHGFSIKGKRIIVNGGNIWVYEFADIATANAASADVSADRYSLTITRSEGEVTVQTHSDWIEKPHLYKKGQLIVVAGDDLDVVNALEVMLGPQFAGG